MIILSCSEREVICYCCLWVWIRSHLAVTMQVSHVIGLVVVLSSALQEQSWLSFAIAPRKTVCFFTRKVKWRGEQSSSPAIVRSICFILDIAIKDATKSLVVGHRAGSIRFCWEEPLLLSSTSTFRSWLSLCSRYQAVLDKLSPWASFSFSYLPTQNASLFYVKIVDLH